MAEALLNHFGRRNFCAFSGGIDPGESVHEFTLQVLMRNDIPTQGLRPKPWMEYALKNAPPIHGAISLCDTIKPEMLAELPGNPSWLFCPLPDPVAVRGNKNDILAAFQVTFEIIRIRVRWLLETQNNHPSNGEFFKALGETPFFSIYP